MKKVFLLVLITLTMLFSGCTNPNYKTNVCKMSEEESGIKVNATAKISSIDEQVKYVDIELMIDLSEYGEEMAAMALQSIQIEFAKYEKYNGVKVKSTNKNAVVTVKMTIDVSKLSTEESTSGIGGIEDLDASLSKCINDLEEQGFTCN